MKAFLPLIFVSLATAMAQAPQQQVAQPAVTSTVELKPGFAAMNAACVDWFIHKKDFGVRRMLSQEEKFQNKQLSEIRSYYHIANMELVSLLKHDPPVVYFRLPPHEPDKARLAIHTNPPNARGLNDFEIAALQKIKAGENVVLEGNEKAFGAIRAQASCLKCHEVEEGVLLGAFSYVLEKQIPPMPSVK